MKEARCDFLPLKAVRLGIFRDQFLIVRRDKITTQRTLYESTSKIMIET